LRKRPCLTKQSRKAQGGKKLVAQVYVVLA
jgi:hypothetical protein